MATLLDDLTAFVDEFPHAGVRDFCDRFGQPVHDEGWCGQWKTYTNLIFLRDGQFVEVRHRNFGNGTQYIALREVEPMTRIRVDVTYVAAHPAEKDEDTYVVRTPIGPDASAIVDALRR